MTSKKIYDGIYKNDNYHGLTQEEHDTLKKNGRVWMKLNP